jgi:hypothetical protein
MIFGKCPIGGFGMGTPSLVGRNRTFWHADAPPALHRVNASMREFFSLFELNEISPPVGLSEVPMDRTRRLAATSEASLDPPCHFLCNGWFTALSVSA